MIVRTSRVSPTLTRAVSATPVTGSCPPFAEITRRAQYSPSASPAGGLASRRMVWRKGAVHTGVTVSGLRTAVVGDSLALWAHLTQQGNAAYIGRAHAVLSDSAGKTVSEIRVPIGVYYAMEPRYTLPIGALAPGRECVARLHRV